MPASDPTKPDILILAVNSGSAIPPDMAASKPKIVKPIAFGAFNHYKIRNVRGFSFVRLSELYAANGQVGFMAFLRSDGGLIDASGGAVKAFQNSAA